MTELHWLPPAPDFRQRLRDLGADPSQAWDRTVALANRRVNFVQTNQLDEAARRLFP